MSSITIYEFDALTPERTATPSVERLHAVPRPVYEWLEEQALKAAELGKPAWLRLSQRGGRRVVQVTSYVGVIRAPNGFQIEVLPKIGKAAAGREQENRQLLIDMLRCLGEFRHIQTDSAKLAATRMPLLEVFIHEFLKAVEHVVKRGLRSDYMSRQNDLFALRGKLQLAQHLRNNLYRKDRFFCAYDEFSTNRPENRLIHTALNRILLVTSSQENHKLARELRFVFADIPLSDQVAQDFRQVRLDRGMIHYADALAWAKLILVEDAPLTGSGEHHAPSLLFPMEAVFEAFVAKH